MTATVDLTNKTFVEGDDWPMTWVLTNPDGSAYDLSNVTKVWFTAKANPDDSDAAAVIGPLDSDAHPTQVQYGGVDPGAGKIHVWAMAAETAGLAKYEKLEYDVQMLESGRIRTPVRGQLRFVHEITQAY
jgi:hypothetical protein